MFSILPLQFHSELLRAQIEATHVNHASMQQNIKHIFFPPTKAIWSLQIMNARQEPTREHDCCTDGGERLTEGWGSTGLGKA